MNKDILKDIKSDFGIPEDENDAFEIYKKIKERIAAKAYEPVSQCMMFGGSKGYIGKRFDPSNKSAIYIPYTKLDLINDLIKGGECNDEEVPDLVGDNDK